MRQANTCSVQLIPNRRIYYTGHDVFQSEESLVLRFTPIRCFTSHPFVSSVRLKSIQGHGSLDGSSPQDAIMRNSFNDGRQRVILGCRNIWISHLELRILLIRQANCSDGECGAIWSPIQRDQSPTSFCCSLPSH